MKNDLDVICIGDANIDITVKITDEFNLEDSYKATNFHFNMGGTVANVAAILARLGVRSSFVGGVANDSCFKPLIIDELTREGVDTSNLIFLENTESPIVLLILDPAGRQTGIAYTDRTASAKITIADIDKIDFSHAKAIHTGGTCFVEEPSRSAVLHAMEKAKKDGLTIYFDPNLRFFEDEIESDYKEANLKAISLSDVVLIGEEELKILIDCKSISDCASELFRLGVKLVIIKKGSKGTEVFSPDSHFDVPVFEVEEVDPNGAGDSFDSGFITAQIRGLDLRQSLDFASAAAALNVTRIGSRNVPSFEEVLAFIGNKK